MASLDPIPPRQNIQHEIDQVPRIVLPSLLYYHLDPPEHAELKHHVEEVSQKEFVQKSLSPIIVPTLLTLKENMSMDMFSKVTHSYKIVDTSLVVRLHFKDIVHLPRLPRSIILGIDISFASYFWKTLWHLLGTNLKFSSAYYPQLDGQTKAVIRSLEVLPRCLVDENIKTSDLVLPKAKFEYHSLTMVLSLFEVIFDQHPRQAIYMSHYLCILGYPNQLSHLHNILGICIKKL